MKNYIACSEKFTFYFLILNLNSLKSSLVWKRNRNWLKNDQSCNALLSDLKIKRQGVMLANGMRDIPVAIINYHCLISRLMFISKLSISYISVTVSFLGDWSTTSVLTRISIETCSISYLCSATTSHKALGIVWPVAPCWTGLKWFPFKRESFCELQKNYMLAKKKLPLLD